MSFYKIPNFLNEEEEGVVSVSPTTKTEDDGTEIPEFKDERENTDLDKAKELEDDSDAISENDDLQSDEEDLTSDEEVETLEESMKRFAEAEGVELDIDTDEEELTDEEKESVEESIKRFYESDEDSEEIDDEDVEAIEENLKRFLESEGEENMEEEETEIEKEEKVLDAEEEAIEEAYRILGESDSSDTTSADDVKPDNQNADNIEEDIPDVSNIDADCSVSDVKDAEDMTDVEQSEEDFKKVEGEGEAAISNIHTEMVKHELQLFESLLGNDIYEIVNEAEGDDKGNKAERAKAVISKILDSGKAILLKIFNTIKSLISTFTLKLSELIKGSNNKLIENYSGVIKGKDLSKFTYSWSALRGSSDGVYSTTKFAEASTKYADELNKDISELRSATHSLDDVVYDSILPKETTYGMISKIFGIKIELGDDVQKKANSKVFEEKKEKTGISDTLISNIEDYLLDSKDNMKTLSKLNSSINKATKIINMAYRVEAVSRRASAKRSGGDTGEQDKYLSKALYKTISDHKARASAISMATGIMLNQYKMKLKESRSVYIGAAKFGNSASKTESAIIESVQSQQIDDYFEGIYA